MLSVCSLNEKLKKSALTVKTMYYTSTRGQVQRRKGHSRLYTVSADSEIPVSHPPTHRGI